jgi:uncharacterized protein YndB with AHSA1/START domain
MYSILHRLTIDATPEHVQTLVATKEGIELWWTGRPVDGDDSAGGRIAVSFGDRTAAVFEVAERAVERIVWRCVHGPSDWIDTTVTFTFEPRSDGGTTLRFKHSGWQEETDLMYGCSTNWGAYLMSLKSGAEGRRFGPFPDGEISRWSQ